MNKLDLTAFLERVRNATGPDRELDRDIAVACGLGNVSKFGIEFIEDDRHHDIVPVFTASVDETLSLVERELSGSNDGPLLYARAGYWNADANNGRNYLQTFHVAIGTPPILAEIEADGVTEPLAILAALLLALTSNQEGNDEEVR